ncbi:MAG: DUF433 domain-containing protein [Symploca sp. SIO3E6]|nr:DUF433 domain-containing protein [Caldora sp. SIO3E6]
MQTLTDIGTLIVQTPGICGGRPRITGHRITVHNIAIDFNAGRKPEDITEERPQLTLAQVYSALGEAFELLYSGSICINFRPNASPLQTLNLLPIALRCLGFSLLNFLKTKR